MTIGDVLKQFLTKLECFSTLFPRIPVLIQKDLEQRLGERFPDSNSRNSKPPITLSGSAKYNNRNGGRRDDDNRSQGRHIPIAVAVTNLNLELNSSTSTLCFDVLKNQISD